jgi:TonB family protein
LPFIGVSEAATFGLLLEVGFGGAKGMAIRKISVVLLLATAPILVRASANLPSLRVPSAQASLVAREQPRENFAMHVSYFAASSGTAVRASCEATQAPEALATPDPLLEPGGNRRVTVSFIVGIDGRVHDALVLESSGPEQDRVVLKAVDSWRYRPAKCNGAATDTEGKTAFSIR